MPERGGRGPGGAAGGRHAPPIESALAEGAERSAAAVTAAIACLSFTARTTAGGEGRGRPGGEAVGGPSCGIQRAGRAWARPATLRAQRGRRTQHGIVNTPPASAGSPRGSGVAWHGSGRIPTRRARVRRRERTSRPPKWLPGQCMSGKAPCMARARCGRPQSPLGGSIKVVRLPPSRGATSGARRAPRGSYALVTTERARRHLPRHLTRAGAARGAAGPCAIAGQGQRGGNAAESHRELVTRIEQKRAPGDSICRGNLERCFIQPMRGRELAGGVDASVTRDERAGTAASAPEGAASRATNWQNSIQLAQP